LSLLEKKQSRMVNIASRTELLGVRGGKDERKFNGRRKVRIKGGFYKAVGAAVGGATRELGTSLGEGVLKKSVGVAVKRGFSSTRNKARFQ